MNNLKDNLKVLEFKPLKDQEQAFSKEIVLERLLKDESYLKRQCNKTKGQEGIEAFEKLKETKKQINRVFEEAHALWYLK